MSDPNPPRRLQEPSPPSPYEQEQIAYENPGAGMTLAGTLTKPGSGGPHPAAVLITGSGPHDRDETVFGHRPFLVLADQLTRHGVAVLRADDRGVGESTGDLYARWGHGDFRSCSTPTSSSTFGVWTFRQGKIVRIGFYFGEREAREAVGLPRSVS